MEISGYSHGAMDDKMTASNTELKPLNVVVIGGSLAGLMAAIVIRRLGNNVRVLEQNESTIREDRGAGITVGSAAQEFFKTYDLTRKPYYVVCPGFNFLDSESKVKRHLKRPMSNSTWNNLYYRLRANFDAHRSEVCANPPTLPKNQGDGVMQMGAKVTNITNGGEDVIVEYREASKGILKSVRADLVIAADGASSTIREILLPDTKRTYSGYFAFRGIVSENDVSQEVRKLLGSKVNAYSYTGGYILCYMIPGSDGSLEMGHRRLNWVWYSKCEESSSEFDEILTDSDGKRHRNSIPRGKMRKDIWEIQRTYGNEILNVVFCELINKTTEPFLSVIQDYAATKAAFFDGKVLLIGDALATFRPHLALSLNQSAVNAYLLESYIRRQITLKALEGQLVKYGRLTQLKNVVFGNFFLYGGMVTLRSVVALVAAYIRFLLPL